MNWKIAFTAILASLIVCLPQANASRAACQALAKERKLTKENFGGLVFHSCEVVSFTTKVKHILPPDVCVSDAGTGWTSTADIANGVFTFAVGGGGNHSTNIQHEATYKHFRVDAQSYALSNNSGVDIEFSKEKLFGFKKLAFAELSCKRQVIDDTFFDF